MVQAEQLFNLQSFWAVYLPYLSTQATLNIKLGTIEWAKIFLWA
jgi:hypothetical protein